MAKSKHDQRGIMSVAEFITDSQMYQGPELEGFITLDPQQPHVILFGYSPDEYPSMPIPADHITAIRRGFTRPCSSRMGTPGKMWDATVFLKLPDPAADATGSLFATLMMLQQVQVRAGPATCECSSGFRSRHPGRSPYDRDPPEPHPVPIGWHAEVTVYCKGHKAQGDADELALDVGAPGRAIVSAETLALAYCGCDAFDNYRADRYVWHILGRP